MTKSKKDDRIGDCTDEEILTEAKGFCEMPCFYLTLLYVSSLERWVIKPGHTAKSFRERMRGLNSEYGVHKDQYFKNKIPRIIPLCIARAVSLRKTPLAVEAAFKEILSGLQEPITIGTKTKVESGTDYAEIYDRYLEFCADPDNKCRLIFESERCVVDPDYIEYDGHRIWSRT